MDKNHIIRDFWYGNITPQTNCRPKSPEVKELEEYITRHHSNLAMQLTEEQLEVLDKLDACWDEYISRTEEAIFSYAFSLGMRMAFESLGQTFDREIM